MSKSKFLLWEQFFRAFGGSTLGSQSGVVSESEEGSVSKRGPAPESPQMAPVQLVGATILLVMGRCSGLPVEWTDWAEAWLSGKDRSRTSATRVMEAVIGMGYDPESNIALWEAFNTAWLARMAKLEEEMAVIEAPERGEKTFRSRQLEMNALGHREDMIRLAEAIWVRVGQGTPSFIAGFFPQDK